MNRMTLLVVVLAASSAACGGAVADDSVTDQQLNAQTRTAVNRSLTRCSGSVSEMSATFQRGFAATSDTMGKLLAGKWLRCPAHEAQFKESFGVEVSSGEICPLQSDATGKLVSHVAESCVPWKVSPPPFDGVELGGVITGADFSADAQLFRACANPYCAVYVRLGE